MCVNRNFPKLVKSLFNDFSHINGLKITSELENEVSFRSNHCYLSIRCEYNYVETLFKKNLEDRWLVIGPYIRAKFPEEEIRFTKRLNYDFGDAVSLSIIDNLELLEKYGSPFLKGDFTWQSDYLKFE